MNKSPKTITQEDIKSWLPHLFGQPPFYKWSREFFNSETKINVICAGNQVGKSTSCIRKNIHWATDTRSWARRWPRTAAMNKKPSLFWYFYPTLDLAHEEFEEKWLDLMPRNRLERHPIYGWKLEIERRKTRAIRFNSGTTIRFKAYSMPAKTLQSATVYMASGDEELPEDYVPEIMARLNGVDGYFNAVFTATIGQQFWEYVVQPPKEALRELKEARVWQISITKDCMELEDGTPSKWAEPGAIEQVIARCPNEQEIKRRIHGQFTKKEGLVYPAFSRLNNMCEPHHLPLDGSLATAVDLGSGGENHPPAIVFVWMDKKRIQFRVIDCWREDKKVTVTSDILEKYIQMARKWHDFKFKRRAYDHGSSQDLKVMAQRKGLSFVPADKKIDNGVGTVNLLFKSGCLKIFTGCPQREKLAVELSGLRYKDNKIHAKKDDLASALRYAIHGLPINYREIFLQNPSTSNKNFDFNPQEELKDEITQRREARFSKKQNFRTDTEKELAEFQQEIDNWGC